MVGTGAIRIDISQRMAEIEALFNFKYFSNFYPFQTFHRSYGKFFVAPNTPQIAYKVTAYKVDSAYKVGFCWNQIILGIFIVIIDLILSRYSVACKVG